jgi:alkylated DNA repair dioxygenase AlkB
MSDEKTAVTTAMQMPQETLIPTSDPEIPGLLYWPRFISEPMEKTLLAALQENPNWVGVSPGEKSRRVIHYGYKYDYSKVSDLTRCDAIPEMFAAIPTPSILRCPNVPESLRVDADFDQLIINEYLPGQGIAPHTDHVRQFGHTIFCVSLGAGIIMTFFSPEGRAIQRWIAAGSAYAMTGSARYKWKHAIDAKKSDMVYETRVPRGTRYSLTYRIVVK